MTYTYGLHGAPAVGGGLPGLPQRAVRTQVSGAIQVLITDGEAPGDSWLLADGETRWTNSPQGLSPEPRAKLANPAVLPTGNGQGCSFSPDGEYLALAHDSSPYLSIYKRSGDTFTKLSNPSVLPPSTGRSCSFSPDGNYLAVAHDSSPYLSIYKRSGDTFTKIAYPAVPPTGIGQGCSFSPDGEYLAVAHSNSPNLSIYAGATPFIPTATPYKAYIK